MGKNGKLCPYIEFEPQTQEGWQAWDVTEKILSQVENNFPIQLGLELGKALGYNVDALAELLPAVAITVKDVLVKLHTKNNGR